MEERRTTQIRYANRELQLAVAQETDAGNPVIAAKHYVTAIELVLNAIEGMRHSSPQAADYFHFQVRQKLEDYYERVKLLLTVAEEEGLDVNLEDCMPFQKMNRGGPPPMLPGFTPPALGVPVVPFATGQGAHELPPMPLGFTHQQPPTPHLGYPTGPDQVFGFLPTQGLPQLPSIPLQPSTVETLATPATVPPPSVSSATPASPKHMDPSVPSEDDLEKAFAALTACSTSPPTKAPQDSEEVDEIDVPMSFLIQPQDEGRPASAEGSKRKEDDDDAPSVSAPQCDSVVRRMFQEDDHMRPGNPSFDELFKKFAEMDGPNSDA
jgi:hypothetical protein